MRTWLRISNEIVLLKWDDEQLNEIILNMYSPWQCDDSVPDYEIIIEKSHQGYILTSPLSTEICSFERLLIYRLENALTLLSQKILSSHTQIHASCVDFNGRGVLISGSHGTGKTTLALTAIAKGFKALTDDITILSKNLKTVKGFPRPFKVTDFTWNMHPGIVPDDCPVYKLYNGTTYVFYYIPPGRYYTDKTRLKHIIFPIRREGYTEIRDMGETEALRKVLAQGMNFYLKDDGCVNDVLILLRKAPPLELAFSDHWDAIRKIRSLLK